MDAPVDLIITFAAFALGYTAYYTAAHSEALAERIRVGRSRRQSETVRVLVHRTVMVVGFGVIPAALLLAFGEIPFPRYGLAIRWVPVRAAIIAGLSVVVAAVIALNPGRDKLTAVYPQMRLTAWYVSDMLLNVAGWAAYLFAYELMFRGFLLQTLVPYSVTMAVAVNTALYVAAHVPKGLSEAVAAIPFGLLLCYLTLAWGSVWPAFILHLVLALANAFVAIASSGEMRMVWRWRPTRDSLA